MDWGHLALGGVIILIVLIRGFARHHHRSVELTFKWREHHDDSADGRHQ